MNTIKKKLILLFISVFLFLITLNIFKPIFTAKNLIFPYSINKFDIVTEYPLTWKYIKILYWFCLLIILWLYHLFKTLAAIYIDPNVVSVCACALSLCSLADCPYVSWAASVVHDMLMLSLRRVWH